MSIASFLGFRQGSKTAAKKRIESAVKTAARGGAVDMDEIADDLLTLGLDSGAGFDAAVEVERRRIEARAELATMPARIEAYRMEKADADAEITRLRAELDVAYGAARMAEDGLTATLGREGRLKSFLFESCPDVALLEKRAEIIGRNSLSEYIQALRQLEGAKTVNPLFVIPDRRAEFIANVASLEAKVANLKAKSEAEGREISAIDEQIIAA